MALAGQAQLDRLGSTVIGQQSIAAWRRTARVAYNGTLLLAGVALVALAPPRFDYSWPTILAVAIVAVFVLLNERPQEGFQGGHAPLTAILAAAVVAVGAWALPLGIIAWSAIHFRVLSSGRPVGAFVSGLAGQLGMTTLAIYAMLWAYHFVPFAVHAIPVLSALIIFFGVVVVGMLWQTVNNALVSLGFYILGQPASFVRYWRAGFVASLWAYLLAGMYGFGGIFGAIVFYYVVAHTRMFERIIQAVEARDERDFVAAQFQDMIREFIGLLAPEDAQFAGDVRFLALALGNHIGLPKADLAHLAWAAEFHEIGKCRLPADVRSGKHLTPSQQSEALRYPMLGAQVLRKASKVIPEEVAYAVEHQCEAFDGTGYPHGMRATNIPVMSRIIAIARDYLRLLTGHAGMEPMPKQEALKTLQARAGAQYDPGLVDLLCRQIA